MGAGIAQVAAQAGLEVFLLDANGDLAERAKARIADFLGKLVAKAVRRSRPRRRDRAPAPGLGLRRPGGLRVRGRGRARRARS